MAPLPIYKSPGGHVQPSKPAWTAPPDWKQKTAARWASNHQDQIANAAMPKMPSSHELQAKANADAWKSVMQMQAALPDPQQVQRMYGSQRDAVLPLIQAHRDWLQKAGEYQVNQTNAISQMTQGAAQAGDAQAAGGAAAAGGPLGASFAGNVAPAGVAMPQASYGTSFANYLHALVPYADAIGGSALSKINSNETDAMNTLDRSRKEIALKQPELSRANFSDNYSLASNEYKSELAALVQGQKGGTDAAKTAETTRHNTTMEQIAKDRNAISSRRADAAIQIAKQKGVTAASGKNSTPLRLILNGLQKVYETKGGTKQPTGYGVVMKSGAWTDALNRKHPAETHPIKAGTPEHLKALIKTFYAQHKPVTTGPNKGQGVWSQGDVIKPTGETAVKGQAGEYTRRMNAWRYLVAQNNSLPQPMTTPEMQNLFRSLYPKTK